MILKEWQAGSSKSRARLLLGLLVAALCALYAGILSTKGLPPTEGWYSYYAYLINEEGAIPYLDFELLFPPLYTYLIALFTRIFGYSLMALRIFGALIYALTGLFAYLIFEKISNRPIFSFLAGLLTAAVLQSEVVQIFYDYIRLMDLSVYAAIYFFLCAVEKIEKEGRLRFFEPCLLLGAVFATAASLFKQSSGLIFLLYCFIFFLFASFVTTHRGLYLKALASSVSTAAVLYGGMVLFLHSQGSLSAYLYYNFRGAVAAKGGSLWAVLFGWLTRTGPKSYAGLAGGAILGLVALSLFLCWRASKKAAAEKKKTNPLLLWGVVGGAFLLLFVISVVFFDRLSIVLVGSYQIFAVFLVGTICFAAVSISLIVSRIKKKELPFDGASLCFLSGAVFILGYSVCTSGGLVESQVALGFPLVVLLFLPFLRFRGKEWVALSLAALMLFTTGIGWTRKLRHIYNWWGLDVGSYAEQTVTTDLPLLRGIRMRKEYAAMYEGVVRSVERYTEEGEEIFVFPHMPVLYLLSDRPRATDTAIQWFDVSTDRAVVEDIEVLREKKPKVLVICRIDEYVISSHESSFRQGEKSGLNQMQEFLEKFVAEEAYRSDGAYLLCEGYTVEVFVLP